MTKDWIFEVTQMYFCLPVDREIWDALEKYDEAYINGDVVELEIDGVGDINYNGHFGMNFFFCCDPCDVKRVERAVKKRLEEIVDWARDYPDNPTR